MGFCVRCGNKFEGNSSSCPVCGSSVGSYHNNGIYNSDLGDKRVTDVSKVKNKVKKIKYFTVPISFIVVGLLFQGFSIIMGIINEESLRQIFNLVSYCCYFSIVSSILFVVIFTFIDKKKSGGLSKFLLRITILVPLLLSGFLVYKLGMFDSILFNFLDDKSIFEDSNYKVVGDSKFGYIAISKNWNIVKELDDNNEIINNNYNKYSYSGIYDLTFDVIDTDKSVSYYFNDYVKQIKTDSNISDVKTSIISIGSKIKYSANKVTMYDNSKNTYLFSYYFDIGDGVIRYISLEGPESNGKIKLEDFEEIPRSFSITK